MALLITPADKAFSLCVRERANWRCERCGRVTPDDKRMGLHCSHWIGRGSWSVRFNPLNAFAHCYGCHAYFEGRPALFTDWVVERHGKDVADKLKALSHKPAKGLRKRVGEIAKWYRQENKAQLQKRKEGDTGWLPFVIAVQVPDIEMADWTNWALQHVS